MNNKIAWILLASLGIQLGLPIAEGLAVTPQESKTLLLAERGNRGGGGGGGNRANHSGGGGNRPERSGGGGNRAEHSSKNLNRASAGGQGSGRVQRDTANRPSRSAESRQVNRNNVNRSGDRQTSNRIERPQAQNRNIDRNQTRDRVNNSRDVNVNRDRTVNVDRNRTVNVDRNRNAIVNPRGGAAWGWNRGVAWAPRTNYWGGGFWGPFAIGTAAVGMTSAIINAGSSHYYTVEQNTPGYNLLSSYGLVQTQCSDDPNLVYMYGPQDSLICANPNNLVPSGDYDINIDTLTLVAR
jgi:hypothetical protein